MQPEWERLLSDKVAHRLEPSLIGEMMMLVKELGAISFTAGEPSADLYPLEDLRRSFDRAFGEASLFSYYPHNGGLRELRRWISDWMKSDGLAPRWLSEEEVLLTNGSQEGIHLLAEAFIAEGDAIIVESPTYPEALLTFRRQGARFLSVPVDRDGIIPEALEKVLRTSGPVKFIYTIVNFHNPAGVTLSVERRKKLLEIASKYGILIFEDDPYGHLRYDGDHLPTIFSLDNEGLVLFACSFSKILAPGTRVAWAVGDRDLIRSLVMVKQGVDLCTSVVAQALVYEYCRQGNMDSFLPKIIAHYGKKRDAMAQAFAKHLPADVRFVKPQGGFFFWLKLPGVDTTKLFFKAIEHKVAFVTGPSFFPAGGGSDNLRTCFTFAAPDQIEEGARRLAQAIADLKKG